MIGQDPLYQVLSSLYDARTLASSSVPGVIRAMQSPFGRVPLQIQAGNARNAPLPKLPEESGSGGIMGLMTAGASLFQPGGPLSSYMGAGTENGWDLFSGGNVGGMFGKGYTNTSQGPISWR